MIKITDFKKGFNLIEIMVVIGIIGIIVLIGVPAFRGFQLNLQLSGATRNLVSDLHYAQQLAVTEQIEHCIYLFPVEKKYQLIQCDQIEPLKEVFLPEEIKTLTTTGFTDNKARYNPYGAVKEAGIITLENTKDKTKTIEVKPSGFVKITN
ncbi:prepilin-type N-terminal cleavage/methylation domain-containing protein [Patescibacteria group bacterium]